MLTSQQIRQQFIDYFVQRHAHSFVPSSPVVPHDDPTLLFTNAGMNQFKDVFLATGSRPYTRAVNTQKCIRAGGKHNDLEDVGKDTYHHTFFEMLGNWSFGDYFKKQAIEWAWDLLTNVWGLDKSRLHVTVFGGDEAEGLKRDDEAAELWRTLTDIDPSHIHDGSKKDNFWEMGDTGPCGPCSEIHIDLTPDKSGASLVNGDDARVMEIWNLVFIQFNRGQDGKLNPLPAQHVDTGMGFERICAVLQGKSSNYDTDVFTPLFGAIQQVTGARDYTGRLDDPTDMAYRVIADHIRCLTFALTDGAVPSNEGRGYVLRRILRRAVRHGYQTLGIKQPFLCDLVPAVVNAMGDAFPELSQQPGRVAELIREEEESFGRTLERGIELFDQAARSASGSTIPAQDAFKLHDTYGFPLDLTQVMAEERGMQVDVAGFNQLMQQAREQARAAGGQQDTAAALIEIVQKHNPPASEFVGYQTTELTTDTDCQLYLLSDGAAEPVEQAQPGQTVALVVRKTPYYAEAGGQVGDVGTIETPAGQTFRVHDTQRAGQAIFHIGSPVGGSFSGSAEPTTLTLRVDEQRRLRIMANHTGTHMMNRALKVHVGDHVQQRGSLVDDQRLRFDFSHQAAMGPEQVSRVEQTVNADIASNQPVFAGIAPLEQARQIRGLRAVFGEKYPDNVRVVSIGAPVPDLLSDPDDAAWENHSIEFCGGTHLPNTGQAYHFVIVQEEAVAKGVRRITALTREAAQQAASEGQALLARLHALRESAPGQWPGGVAELGAAAAEKVLPLLDRQRLREGLAELQRLIKQQDKARGKEVQQAAVQAARALAEQAEGNLIVASIPQADGNTLRTAMDVIRKKKPDAALLLGAVTDDKVSFVAAVPKALIAKGLKAGDWVREVAKVAGGGGGGRPDMAQAGGKDPAKLDDALQLGRQWAAERI